MLAAAPQPGSALPGPVDLTVPPVSAGDPAPGQRVRVVLPAYAGTEVCHLVYLPTDYGAGERYPVICEYPGNGPHASPWGDLSSGLVEGCRLGYGISGGQGSIWVSLPLISTDHRQHQRMWWGDVAATVDYCLAAVEATCGIFGGRRDALVLAGFSRGALACNYLGLHDDRIAALWRGFVAHSHYDGVHRWGCAGDDRAAAAARLARLRRRPQFISHEGSVQETRDYLATACPAGRFTFLDLPFPNHTADWVLRDNPERATLRHWYAALLTDPA